ncbi:MAG: glycosyltransferase [Desulfobacterales bacterium]|nr:glycosyltransferase [Desulfobacterales bacterium]
MELVDKRKKINPICSICVANYNGIKFIDACIDSVLNQDCNFEIELLIHDDASTDNSVEHIKSKYPFLTLIESKSNVGFCVSNNRLAAIARGEYILFLNNDAVLFPDAIKTLFHHATQKDGSNKILGLPQYNASTDKIIDIGSTFDIFLNPVPNLSPVRKEVGMVIGACLWIPKPFWEELGGFPDWFNTLAEDMYISCLSRLKGFPVNVIHASGFYHWVGRSLGGGKVTKNRLVTSIKRRTLSELNKTYVMILCYPTIFFQFIFPLHLILLFGEGLLLCTIKKDSTIFKSIYFHVFVSLWSNRKRLLRLRKKFQNEKKINSLNYFSTFSLIPHKLRMLLKHGIPELF